MIEFELGYNVLSFENIVESPKSTPLKTAFTNFKVKKRESWDPITVMYAVLGVNDLYEFSELGTVVVTNVGETVFEKNANGNVQYLIEKVEKEKIVETLNAFPL
jgi:hypothetical protein